MSDLAQQLQKSQIFAGIDEAVLNELISFMHRKHVEPNTILFHQGDEGDEMYIILSGRIRIFLQDEFNKETTFRFFGPGDLFGEFTPLDQKPRSASAEVTEEADLLTLNRESFLEFLKSRPAIGLRMMRQLAGRIRYTTKYLQAAVDSSDLMSKGQYKEAIDNIKDSPSEDIHNLAVAFWEMIESVQKREESLRKQLAAKKGQSDEESQENP